MAKSWNMSMICHDQWARIHSFRIAIIRKNNQIAWNLELYKSVLQLNFDHMGEIATLGIHQRINIVKTNTFSQLVAHGTKPQVCALQNMCAQPTNLGQSIMGHRLERTSSHLYKKLSRNSDLAFGSNSLHVQLLFCSYIVVQRVT